MKSLAEFHLKNNAVMGVYNNRTLVMTPTY